MVTLPMNPSFGGKHSPWICVAHQQENEAQVEAEAEAAAATADFSLMGAIICMSNSVSLMGAIICMSNSVILSS